MATVSSEKISSSDQVEDITIHVKDAASDQP